MFQWCKLWNFEPTSQQTEVLRAVQDFHMIPPKERTKLGVAVASGRGTGKTALSVIVSSWRQIRFPRTRTVVTAPNFRQCSEIYIGEFSTLLGRAEPILRRIFTDVTSKKIKTLGDNRWDIIAATASDPGKIAGFHDEHLGYVFEECGGMDREIVTAIRGSLTNDDAFIFAIGNPLLRDSVFYDFFSLEPETWHLFHLNSEDSPIISKNFIDTMERDFGRESDAYRVHVLGQFPKADPDGVLSGEDLRACTKTDKHKLSAKRDDLREYCQFGMDFARYGSDESVTYQRQGNAVVAWKRYAKVDPNDVIDEAFVMEADTGWGDREALYVFDAGGMGQGLAANFYRANKRACEFHNGGKSTSPKYANKISEAWFNLRRLVRARECWIPDDPILMRQLEGRRYTVDKKGKILVEPKEEYVKRTEQGSPDRADALVMAFYDGGISQGSVSRVGSSPTRKSVRVF